MGKKVYFPFGIVTLIQFIGNIFFAYQYIDINSQSFKDWVDLVDPLVSFLGVESGDPLGHKRFLAFFSGGMLPIISLSFLHMLVKFEEEDKKEEIHQPKEINIEELSTVIGKQEAEFDKEKYTPTPEELEKLEIELIKFQKMKDLEDTTTGTNGPDESSLFEVEVIPTDESSLFEAKETSTDEIKRISYLRRDA
jgi:hypothetical protein